MLELFDRREGLKESCFHLAHGVSFGESVGGVRVGGGEIGEEDGSLGKARDEKATRLSKGLEERRQSEESSP